MIVKQCDICGKIESIMDIEGLVGRPKVDLYDRNGNRALVKVKWNDVKELG